MAKRSFSLGRYEKLCEDYAGLCLACGEIQESGVEPDATGYHCASCEANQVCGIEYALLIGQLSIDEDEEDDEDDEFDDDDDDDDDDEFDDEEDELDDEDDDEFDDDDLDDDELEAVTEDKDRRRGLYGPEYAGEKF